MLSDRSSLTGSEMRPYTIFFLCSSNSLSLVPSSSAQAPTPRYADHLSPDQSPPYPLSNPSQAPFLTHARPPPSTLLFPPF